MACEKYMGIMGDMGNMGIMKTMEMTGEDYRKTDKSMHPAGTRYQVLLSGERALSMMDEWLVSSCRADLRVRRAKTAKMVVLETTDVVFASRMVLCNPGCRVNIVFPKK